MMSVVVEWVREFETFLTVNKTKGDTMKKNRTLYLCQGALVAALYVLLTLISSMLGLDKGMIQLRLSEALCILPVFLPAAIPGLSLGCLLSNLLLGGVWLDWIVGPLATLIGAMGTYLLRKYKWLSPLPAVVSNTLLIPVVLCYGYGIKQGIPLMMLTVGIGELISVYGFGMLIYGAIEKQKRR